MESHQKHLNSAGKSQANNFLTLVAMFFFGAQPVAHPQPKIITWPAHLHSLGEEWLTGAFYVGNGWVAGGCWDDY